jgi:hypothetical protein
VVGEFECTLFLVYLFGVCDGFGVRMVVIVHMGNSIDDFYDLNEYIHLCFSSSISPFF